MPVPYTGTRAPNEGGWVFAGMWGAAFRNGQMLMEVTEVSGQISVNRVDVPLVGRSRLGHKRGRETREGNLTIQKIDGSWEFELWKSITVGVSERRAARDEGRLLPITFVLELWYDDPDALGTEGWRLGGCQLWDLPIGINIGDDLVNRQFTMTWDTEEPLKIFEAIEAAGGVAAARYYPGYGA